MKLNRKVCIVTGAASGIGAAICRAFHAEGAIVTILDIDFDGARSLAATLDGAVAVRCDVSQSSSVDDAFAGVADRFGGIDVLVSNAGIVGHEEYRRILEVRGVQLTEMAAGKLKTPLRAVVSLTDEQWLKMIAVNLTGTFYCVRAALREMEKRETGNIITISSIVGIDGGLGNPHYAASKAGILGLTRSLAKEAIQQGIRVNAIAPGFVNTPLREATITDAVQKAQIASTPIGRAATAEEIAKSAVFLASDDSSYYVGQTLSPNGGYLTQ